MKIKRTHAIAWLLSLAFLIVVFSGYAIVHDDYDHEAPTLSDICAGKNWPIDDDAKLAYSRACENELAKK
jgi:hypothetical protein